MFSALLHIGLTSLFYGVAASLSVACLWWLKAPPLVERIGGIPFSMGFSVWLYGASVILIPCLTVLLAFPLTLRRKIQWVAFGALALMFSGAFAFLLKAETAQSKGYVFLTENFGRGALQKAYDEAVEAHYQSLSHKPKWDLCKIARVSGQAQRVELIDGTIGGGSSGKGWSAADASFSVRLSGVAIPVRYTPDRIYAHVHREECASLFLVMGANLLAAGDKHGAFGALGAAESLSENENQLAGIRDLRKKVMESGYSQPAAETGVRWIDGVAYRDSEGGDGDDADS